VIGWHHFEKIPIFVRIIVRKNLIKEKKQKHLQILVVEDNQADIRLMQEALKESGLTTVLHVATDGIAALNSLRQIKQQESSSFPDIILLDLNLSGCQGLDLLSHIKSDANFRRIPVIVLSSSSRQEDILRSYELHANCYVRKPVDLEPFIDLMKSIENFWSRIVRLPYD
jgi:chemotaxis family two-component system response regulator Rcp1